MRSKTLSGFRINRHCLVVSHLLFADDSVVYFQATEWDCNALDRILKLYENASGQRVNKDKASILFSPNTPHAVRLSLSERVGISLEANNAKYLGLLVFLGLSKWDLFSYIKNRTVKNRTVKRLRS